MGDPYVPEQFAYQPLQAAPTSGSELPNATALFADDPLNSPLPVSEQPPTAALAAPVAVSTPAPAASSASPPSPGTSSQPTSSAQPAAPAAVVAFADDTILAPTPETAEGVGRSSTERTADDGFSVNSLLTEMVDSGASDLHLTAGSPPMIRLRGELRPLGEHPKLQPPSLQRVLYAMLSQRQRERFETELELDFAYAVPGKARFRVNIYRQREALGAAFRLIPYEIKPLEALGIPPAVNNFAGLPRGLVLVTGPTGSGKSTTLAGIIDLANRTRKEHIMTVEDPIEFLHRHKGCIVNQREVGEDTKSFTNALKHALRQDPDIILVGEMRDLETISVALTAAETGHLVFGTLHTQDAAQTMDRVIDVFPSEQQQQVRVQLAGAIQGVVCQTLCKTRDGKGRAVATEVMVATPAIRNLVREGKTHQIYSAMQAGAQHGMHTMDQHLAELVRTNQITYEHGLEKCHHVEDFNRLLGRI
ncbi:MAG: type IV pilus twitching motility protein PilT [Actinomycetota bacterium]